VAEPVDPAALKRRVTIAPNGGAAIGAGALMFVLAAETRSVWLQVVGCGIVGLLAISFFRAMQKGQIVVDVQAPAEAIVGVPFAVTVTVDNIGKRESGAFRILSVAADAPAWTDALVTMYVDPIPVGETRVATVMRTLAVRGGAHAFVVRVEEFAPFGFFVGRTATPDPMTLHVGPAPAAPIELQRVSGEQPDHNGPMGPGLEVRGVREWRPGDATRHVHWRSTARTGRLTVLEHGEPGIGAVGVLAMGRAGEQRFEHGVAVAAATARWAQSDGVDVVHAFEIDGRGRLEWLTPQTFHSTFAHLGYSPIPGPPTVQLLLDAIGRGGVLILAFGADVPSGIPAYVYDAAAASDVRILDLTEQSRGAA
jgi:uncharacterized protein (DUF58 family)